MNRIISLLISITLLILVGSPAIAATSLDALLNNVKQSASENAAINREREQRFLADKSKKQAMLNEARKQLQKEKSRTSTLKKNFDRNEKNIASLEEKLHQRMGSLGELIGVYKQIAGDAAGVFEQSLVSAQISGRTEQMRTLAQQKALPSIADLEALWFALQQEMTETGKVSRYQSTVLGPDGSQNTANVTRAGSFNAVSNGRFLRHITETNQLAELARQPGGDYLATAQDFESASSGYAPMVIDPSRGVLLGLLVQTPALFERIKQGKLIGYIILALGIVGLLLVLERLLRLTMEEKNIVKQASSNSTDQGNPLGRILTVYENNKANDLETLERQIDEAILKETPKLERGLPIIKILSVIAPLLGLLGTVTGMIETFQSITLFGTGDPKLMAGGISQALITTVLGLVVAIPLILLHSVASNKSKRCINILEEQSAGMIALRAGGGT